MTTCNECQTEFSSSEALAMHQQMKHQQQESLSREERKGLREEGQQKQQQQRKRWKRLKSVLFYSIIIVGAAVLIWGIFSLAGKRSFSGGQIHWHADLKLTVCGEDVPLPQPTASAIVHGEPFVGTPFMHLHSGPQIHIEGVVSTTEEIMIGKFMDVISMHLTDTELLDKKNGDACPDGQPGKVKLFINGQESNELTKHVIRDGERIEIRFE